MITKVSQLSIQHGRAQSPYRTNGLAMQVGHTFQQVGVVNSSVGTAVESAVGNTVENAMGRGSNSGADSAVCSPLSDALGSPVCSAVD